MDLAPVLSDAGLTAEADALVDQGTRLVDAHFPDATGRYARELLLGLRAHLRWAEGDADAAVDALVACLETAGDAASTLLRRLWRLLEAPVWAALGARPRRPRPSGAPSPRRTRRGRRSSPGAASVLE